MTGTVLTERRGGVLEITLNRPDKLNSFDAAQHADLRAALDMAAAPEVRAVILTGAGRGFCAGADLGAAQPKPGEPRDLGQSLRDTYNPLILAIRALEKPVIAAVNGPAAGAGVNIALACDIVLAASSASFLQAFARIGLVPDAGGTWTLPRIVGEARAKAMMLLAEPITAQQARDFGMVWKVIDDSALMDEARAMAEKLANAPTFGLGQAKLAIQASGTTTLEEQLEVEAAAQTRCGVSHDFEEGVAAFLQKRKPQFTGQE
ncbi:2-(1,2-epoxy-1,2-dihydrophenyl)acetyl-CoA isomerase PaaG [Rhodovulum sp. DZ06]|uniref:2-(1,2-epoxy-1,2-dihydrophenyl)acetyl-CoA isomerase PaaG n=1 Tax=Rhodovulum sp. DZ06 TaxID=3425126 RepID=UPI003D341E70